MNALRGATLLFFTVVLGACAASEASRPPVSSGSGSFVTPLYGPPHQLDVADVTVVRRYAEPRQGHRDLYPMDLGDAVDRWAADQLRAVGRTGRARVYVENAQITEHFRRESKPRSMTFDRFRQYDGILHVRIEVTDTSTQRVGFANGHAQRTATAGENASRSARETIGWRMSEDLLNDLDAVLDANIERHLGNFLY